MEDTQLRATVRAAAGGDQAAAGELFDRYHPRVYRYVLAKLRDPSDAEDVAAETFARLVRDLRNFKWRAAGFEAWLFRIAGNLVIDHIRKSSRRPATVEIRDDHSIESATPESSALAGELTQEIANMLETLPPDQREVLLLRFAGGLNTEETAVVMDRKPNAVRQLQFRALGRLRETMPQRVTR